MVVGVTKVGLRRCPVKQARASSRGRSNHGQGAIMVDQRWLKYLFHKGIHMRAKARRLVKNNKTVSRTPQLVDVSFIICPR